MAWVAVVAGGTALVGAFVSNKASSRAKDAANRNMDQAAGQADLAQQNLEETQARIQEQMDRIQSLTPPNLQQYIMPAQMAVIKGEITPEMATAQVLEQTKLAGITVPPALMSAQNMAMTKLSEIADQGGLTAMDRARLFDIKGEMATASRGAQEAILQEAQRRGVSGSGIEMGNRMLADQAASTRGAGAGLNVAAEAQKRALEAIQSSGNMAGRMRDQDFTEQGRVGDAQDAIARFNTNLTNATNTANTATRNAADVANLQERQRLSEFNIGQREREAAARLGTGQTGWQNTYNQSIAMGNLAAGQATGAQNASITANNQAANASAAAVGAGDAQRAAALQGLGTGLGSLGQAYANNTKTPTTSDTSSFRWDDPYKNKGYVGGGEGE